MTNSPQLKVYGPDEVELSEDNISVSTDQVIEGERESTFMKIDRVLGLWDKAIDATAERVGDAMIASFKIFFSELFSHKKSKPIDSLPKTT